MAASNSSVSEQDGRYGNSSKQLLKEWGSKSAGVTESANNISFSGKDALKESEKE